MVKYEEMKNHTDGAVKYGSVLLGSLLFSIGVNLLIVPVGLFNGGLLGMAQLFRTLVLSKMNLPLPPGFDVAGILYFLLNIPMLIIAYLGISKQFFLKTILCVTAETFFMSVIPILSTPLIDEKITSCILGGIIAGYGAGLILRSGGSGGGLDVVGVYFSRKYKDVSVGKMALLVNSCVYLVCALALDIPTAIYSIIYSTVSSLAVDRAHYQNIMVQATIITSQDGVDQLIIKNMERGVTTMRGTGAYTHESRNVLLVCVSRYEVNALRRLVHEIDPSAFIVYSRIYRIDGNFLKHMDS